MYRILFISLIGILLIFTLQLNGAEEPSHLLLPLKGLFSHRIHKEIFEKMKLDCFECHNFSIKSIKKGPLGTAVPRGYIRAPRHVCHACHFGKIELPRPNQCGLCHTSSDVLKPKSHLTGWREKHSRMASNDPDSCKQCHTPDRCDQCHSQLDIMNPKTHRANFRLYHSVEARAKPFSCAACHQTAQFCSDCHTGD